MSDQDKELMAMSAVIGAFSGLDQEAQRRVLDYVCKRYRIGDIQTVPPLVQQVDGAGAERVFEPELPNRGQDKPIDIKSLKEIKQPNSSIQMAVLVAYYLKDQAPTEERRIAIGTADIEKYFTQAQFKLPTGKNGAKDTLNNARRGGYFDSAGQGLFKLNAVGFNLAAYNMPTGSKSPRATKKKS